MRGAAFALAGLLLAGCSSAPPKLVPPDSVESFCSGTTATAASVASILSSVADAIQPVDVPNAAELMRTLRDQTGVAGHWKSQLLYMPGTARALGVGGDYIAITDAVIPNVLSGSDSRTIYVTVTTPAEPKRVALRAYDLQNVCDPAHPLG